jgi:hypothetical protein
MARKRRGVSSRKRGKPEPCSVGPNAINHRANAVGALRRQMLLEAERAKGGVRINGKDLFRRSIGKKRDCDRDQTAHEVGIAVAAIAEDRSALALRRGLAFQPHLTDATPDLVGVVMGGRAQRLERMAQLDDVTISILPVIEGGEIVAYVVDRRQENPVTFVCPGILYG